MRVGIAKPDWGITGGFEVVMERVSRALEADGHDVQWRTVDVASIDHSPFGVDVPPAVWESAWEAFRYLGLVEEFRRIDTAGLDIVLSTQPPSFAVEHPRVLALFSHHLRIYYDLDDVYVAAGFADPDLHATARAAVHRVDDHLLHRVTRFLATSEEVARRLERFNGLGARTDVFLTTTDNAVRLQAESPSEEFAHALCVSRHEFPKRTELFVHAMKYLPDTPGVVVGGGGRLDFVRRLDAELSSPTVDLDGYDAARLWCNRGDTGGALAPARRTHVDIRGAVDDPTLLRLYRDALCVVAPAYLEDYGLTAIEAMAAGKPLVVCRDGGGLTDFVDDGVEGFVVEPDGRAIADAVGRFVEDPGLARRMGRAARERAAAFTWERAMDQLRSGMARVLDEPGTAA